VLVVVGYGDDDTATFAAAFSPVATDSAVAVALTEVDEVGKELGEIPYSCEHPCRKIGISA